MSKISRKPNLDETENGFYIKEYIGDNAIEFFEIIEEYLQKKPHGNSKNLKVWRRNANKLIDQFNGKFGRSFKKQ